MHYWEHCRCLVLLLCSTASSSNAFISSTNFSHRLNRGRLKLSKGPDDGLELDSKEISNLIQAAAIDRSIPSSSLLPVLQYLENQNNQNNIPKAILDGSFELVYSSAVANFPIIGTWFDGYLPNKEIIKFDLENGELQLSVETFPFLPAIDIVGENLSYDESTASLRYTVRAKDKPSQWDILYADQGVLAAKSSVTGLNVIRRIS